MADLSDLYQQLILDHCKHPRNFHKMAHAKCKAEGYNPLCGDRVTIYVDLEGDVVKELCFEGSGCAISTATSSLLTEALKGKTLSQVANIFRNFCELVTGQKEPAEMPAGLGKLAVFQGVREFPLRVKCATLPWHTLNAALENKGELVSTE